MRSALISSRVRLAVLLCVLGALGAWALLGRGSGVAASTAGWCERPSGAPSLRFTSRELRALAVREGAVVASGGGDVTAGTVGPSTAWTDALPDRSTPVGGGYEFGRRGPGRAWEAVDVFAFESAADAEDYAAKAGARACRLRAVSQALERPRGARAVTWLDGDGAWETDVFLARGRVAARVAVAAAPDAAAPSVAAVARRACLLRGAAC